MKLSDEQKQWISQKVGWASNYKCPFCDWKPDVNFLSRKSIRNDYQRAASARNRINKSALRFHMVKHLNLMQEDSE